MCCATPDQRLSLLSGALGLSSSVGNSPPLRPENIVHHTINTSNTSAPSASSSNNIMTVRALKPFAMRRILGSLTLALGVAGLIGCATAQPSVAPLASASLQPSGVTASRWQPVPWTDLPGWGPEAITAALPAWLRSCQRPAPAWAPLCPAIRSLTLATPEDKQAWAEQHLQPHRVLERDGSAPVGLLTGYYEPTLDARTERTDTHRVPLYAPPAGLRDGQVWFSRQEIDTLPQAQAALRPVAWLADPIDAMLLQIQGSGRLQFAQPDGSVRSARVAFAGTNGQPYRSINLWLQQQGVPTTPWPQATQAWARANPERVNELLWSNPRVVFFRLEALSPLQAQLGPRGAQGVPLTPGHSIAVDRRSIPYGTPVWLATQGPSFNTQRLVLAQDTGSAIVGAVRADYFAGWDEGALPLAASLKQPLQLWVLWPR